MFGGGSFNNIEYSLPPIMLTQGEIDMLNKGIQWYDVYKASKAGDLDEPIIDGAGQPIRRKLTENEYKTVYANMLNLTSQEQSQLYSSNASSDRDDFDFLTVEGGFFNDTESQAEEYWDNVINWVGEGSIKDGTRIQQGNKWVFDREKALKHGAKTYKALNDGLNTIMSAKGATDRGQTYDLRAEIIGQEITGAPGETAYNQYTSVFDPASPSKVSVGQLKSLIFGMNESLDQNVLKTISIGDNRHLTTAEIGSEAEGEYNNALARKIYDKYIESLVTSKTDKTQGRPFVGISYVEKVGGPEQDDNDRVAGYHLNFGMNYGKKFKDLFGTGTDHDSDAYAKFLKEGITITIPQSNDINPYKSTNQLLSFTDLAIKDNGNYKSTPILNGGNYTIYKNSDGQYIQETTTFSFDEKTGGMPANTLTSITLPVDPSQLDMLVINMDQRLFELQKQNLNKKALWDNKNKNKTKPESNNAQ